MPQIDVTVTQPFIMWQSTMPATILLPDSYGSLEAADIYFANKLRTLVWRKASKTDRIAALREATRLIDNLDFKGEKTDDDQLHEFPRDGSNTPKNIELACYEIAIKLIAGVDPDQQANDMVVTGRTFASVKITYDRQKVVQEYMQARIPSAVAWDMLKPYLKDPKEFTLSRAN